MDTSLMKYWYKICPQCQGQGRLLICVSEQSKKLFLACDECEAAWNKPENLLQKSDFSAYKIPHHIASAMEIDAQGWNEYALMAYTK